MNYYVLNPSPSCPHTSPYQNIRALWVLSYASYIWSIWSIFASFTARQSQFRLLNMMYKDGMLGPPLFILCWNSVARPGIFYYLCIIGTYDAIQTRLRGWHAEKQRLWWTSSSSNAHRYAYVALFHPRRVLTLPQLQLNGVVLMYVRPS